MADVKWIKIVTDIFDDEKIRFIETMPNGDEIIVIWFKILCLCGKSNNGGFLMFTGKLAYTEEMLASIFNRDIKSIQLALKTFESLEMVEMIDNKIYIANWEKHQTLDKLETKKQYDREYQRKKREEKKQLLENRTTVKRLSNDNRITDIDKDIEIDTEEDIEKDKDTELEEKKNIQKKKPTEEKHRYGEYQHVLLTDRQFEKLVNDYGEFEVHSAIKFLDEYIQMKGYKAKDHNLALRKWVFKAVEEEKSRNNQQQSRGNDYWAGI